MGSRRNEKNKKEEDDINRSKIEISIAGEHFSTFTLHLTQQILDIKKDKVSEEKNQEHTPVHKDALKGKLWIILKDQ